MNKQWYLKQIDLFQGIPDREIMQIASKMIERECKKKELLYMPEEINNSIYVLKKGEVTLYNSHYGKRLIIDVLKPGSIFGNITFHESKSTHFAEVTQDAYICIFHVVDFIKILHAKPNLMLNFLQIISDKMRIYETRLKSGLFSAREKVLQQLEMLKDENESSLLGKVFNRKSKITHERLAQLTGLSRETVTRVINQLKKEGVFIHS